MDTDNMKGAAFASYGWDGGWVIGRIEMELKALGVKIVSPEVSAVDQGGVMGPRSIETTLRSAENSEEPWPRP